MNILAEKWTQWHKITVSDNQSAEKNISCVSVLKISHLCRPSTMAAWQLRQIILTTASSSLVSSKAPSKALVRSYAAVTQWRSRDRHTPIRLSTRAPGSGGGGRRGVPTERLQLTKDIPSPRKRAFIPIFRCLPSSSQLSATKLKYGKFAVRNCWMGMRSAEPCSLVLPPAAPVRGQVDLTRCVVRIGCLLRLAPIYF